MIGGFQKRDNAQLFVHMNLIMTRNADQAKVGQFLCSKILVRYMMNVESTFIWLTATETFLDLLSDEPLTFGFPCLGINVPNVVHSLTGSSGDR